MLKEQAPLEMDKIQLQLSRQNTQSNRKIKRKEKSLEYSIKERKRSCTTSKSTENNCRDDKLDEIIIKREYYPYN